MRVKEGQVTTVTSQNQTYQTSFTFQMNGLTVSIPWNAKQNVVNAMSEFGLPEYDAMVLTLTKEMSISSMQEKAVAGCPILNKRQTG